MDSDKNKKITRRKFIKGVAGTAVCCTCFSLDCRGPSEGDSELETEDDKGKVHLAAACGTYCGACPAYINKHGEGEVNYPSEPINDHIDSFVNMMENLQCDGCLSGGTLASHCQSCNIRLHALDTQNDSRCTYCEELPCYRITNLINQGNYPHRQEYLPNLEKIREMGINEWVIYEEERWSCPRCGQSISWYDTRCTACGEPRSEQLFDLP